MNLPRHPTWLEGSVALTNNPWDDFQALKKLAKTIEELTQIVNGLVERPSPKKSKTIESILTKEDIEAWLDGQPTFPNRIAYPTGVNRDNNPTRRKQNQFPLCLNE